MSDTMLYGVLRMPYGMAMDGEIARRQFYGRAQEAADRLEKAERRLAEIDAASTIPASEAGELPPLPEWTKHDDLGGKVPSEVRQAMRDYARAALASTRTASDTPTAIPRESNEALCELARYWKLDGDWMTCKGCKRSLIASRDGEELMHNDGCKFAAQQHPWAKLRALISPRVASDTRTAAGEAECDAALRAAPASQRDAGESADVQYMRNGDVKTWMQRAWEDGCDPNMRPDPKHYTDEMLEEIADLRAELASQGAAQGRITCKESAEVDVEAERKLFEDYFQGFNDLRWPDGAYRSQTVEDHWQGWLVKARTQADAGKDASAAPSAEGE